jgi:hypothetical protein
MGSRGDGFRKAEVKNPFGPKEPYEEFARWSAADTVYVEDADGRLWAGSPRGWSAIAGTRELAERAIEEGRWKYRGELLRKRNPIRRVSGGYQWGSRGHIYPTRAGAARQAAAAYAHGFQEKNPMPLTQSQEAIYRAAVKADERFSHELKRVYGKRAGDMRYRPNLWTDRELKASALRFQRATDRWLKVMRSFRTQNPITAVRKIFYAVSASRGREKLYLKRNGKLTRHAVNAARFSSVKEAAERARAHLKRYPTSRAYRFDVGLAY